MLDIVGEEIVSLNDATALLPRRRKGKKPNVATLYRWAQRGCRGVVLETIQVGGTRCTSVEALQRFCDRLSGATGPSTKCVSPRHGLADVDRQLDEEGL